MKKSLSLICMLLGAISISSCTKGGSLLSITASSTIGSTSSINEGVESMKLKINNKELIVDLEKNETVTALLKILPLKIDMEELNGNEKYYYLLQSLPSNPSKISNINAGDVMLYGDSCLVIFYKSFSTSYSYTKIGHIKNNEDLALVLGNNSIKVEWSI